jgi:hypothetical protein
VGWVAVGLLLTAKAGNIGTNHLFEAMVLDRLVALALGWYALAEAISTTSSKSGLPSKPMRARSWSRCIRASNSLRSQPSSRAICAVGVPLAIPWRIIGSCEGRRWVPCSEVPVKALKTRPQVPHWKSTRGAR